MNSIYGKTIQKSQEFEYKVFDKIEDILTQQKMSLTGKSKRRTIDENIIKQIFMINDQIILKNDKQSLSNNLVVNGCILLSISQRLMNKVIFQINGFKES